jgi:hypothetical protein
MLAFRSASRDGKGPEVGSILFVLIQYLLARAAGVPSGLLPSKELEIREVEKNFFDPNYYARRTIGLLKRAFETFFGTTALAIFFASSAYLFLAAIVCLAVLLVKYAGAGDVFRLVYNGFAIQLQPDEYDRFRSIAGSGYGDIVTEDHFVHAGYPIFVTVTFFIFAYAILSACNAVVTVGLYRFLNWFSGSDRLNVGSVLYRLARLLLLAIAADMLFFLIFFGTPMLLSGLAGVRAYQVPNVQLIQRPDGAQRMLVYRLGVVIRQPDKPFIRYSFGIGLGPIGPSDIPKQGVPRPTLEKHFGSVGVFTSTETFCDDASVLDRRECIRRLTDLSFERIKEIPAHDLFWFVGQVSDRIGKAFCLDTDFVPSDFPPSAHFVFALYMPFLITAVFEGLLGALIVPILCGLYLLNRLVVRIGRWQIVRSELGLSLMTKYGWSLLALPVIVLLAMLQVARTAYCGG